MMPMVVSDGKNVTTIMVPTTISEPDRWKLTVEPYDSEGNALKPVVIFVTKVTYESVKLGEWFTQTEENSDLRKSKKQEAQ